MIIYQVLGIFFQFHFGLISWGKKAKNHWEVPDFHKLPNEWNLGMKFILNLKKKFKDNPQTL